MTPNHKPSTLARAESAATVIREIVASMHPGEHITKGALHREVVRRAADTAVSECVFREALAATYASGELEPATSKSVRRPAPQAEETPALVEVPEVSDTESRLARLERMMERICNQLGVSTE